MDEAEQGLVVAAFGRQYQVELGDGTSLRCFPRGKRSQFACGDRVSIQSVALGQGIITATEPRRTLLHRSDAYRQKLIAANATQIVVVVAAEPSFSAELVSRCLVAAEHQRMRSIIVLNKIDLTAGARSARDALEDYRRLGYPIVEVCARGDAKSLLPWLSGQLSVLVGQSGMGKSTLINALVPGVAAATREISSALDSGKHTTTHARLYHLDPQASVIDSPGLQEFGFAHLKRRDIEHAFIELRPHLDRCRFRDCRHDTEPDCALHRAVGEGSVSLMRLKHCLAICAACA